MYFRSLLLSALFLVAGCDSTKYPYPAQFVAPTDLSERVLPAPPAPDSKRFDEEVRCIAAQQATLSEKEKALIMSENKIAPEMIVQPVLGAKYTRESHPALYTLLAHAGSDAWRLADTNQDYWKSPRPWMADSRVELIAPKITSYGYPSGHTTTNTVWAYVLSELFPAKHDALFKRANDIAHHRMVGGVHFPHDLEGGRALAKATFAKMKTNPAFQQELRAARAELRGAKIPHIALQEPAN